MCQGYLE